MNVVQRVKDLMKERGMIQRDLGKAMGWSAMMTSRKLSGERGITDEELPVLAAVFGMTVDALVTPCDDATAFEPTLAALRNSNVPINLAARVMGKNPQYVRMALQKQLVPFGFAIKGSGNRYVYYISKPLFEEYTGVKLQEVNADA